MGIFSGTKSALIEGAFQPVRSPMWRYRHSVRLLCTVTGQQSFGQHTPEPPGPWKSLQLILPLIFGTQRYEHTSLRKLCSVKRWVHGILIFSGCISTEELWMATNCSYYANATAHLEIAYVALPKTQELLVCKVQFRANQVSQNI